MASRSKEMELAIKIAGKVESSFTGALGTAGNGIKRLTKTLATASVEAAKAVGALAVSAVNVGKEFETAMSQVQATMLLDTGTAEGAAAMATLEEAARECGRTTAFSATEAAEALNYLALAGYDAEQAATALPTVLKLAGAGAMDLAAASDMVTDSMSALQIEATEENLNSFADQLAQTASKANTSVSQLGEAILTVGATGANLAGGTTELNTALGILADNGLKGAEGGTHLRNVILSLQSPTDNASEALKNLGVDIYDTEGNMRGLNNIFGDLSSAMEGMTQEQKDSIISTIFNKTDLTSANALLANCTDRWDELSLAIENSAGACEDMYAIQLDNLDGDIKILQSGLSDLGISIYQDLNGPLRSMTQLATDMVEELSAAYSEGGMQGMVGAIGGCLSEAVGVISEYIPQAVSMGVDLIGGFVEGIADNAGPLADAASEALTLFIDGLFSLVPQVLLAGIDIVTQLANSITSKLPTLISNGTRAITNFVSGIIQRLPAVISTALTLIQTLADSLVANAPMLINAAIQLMVSLLTGILSMLPQLLQTGIQLILSLAQGIIASLPSILQAGVQVITGFISSIAQMLPMIVQGGVQLIISLIQGIIANLGNIAQAAGQIIVALITGLVSAIPQIFASAGQLVGAIIDAIFETDWIEVGGEIIGGIADGFMSGFFGLGDKVKGLWNSFTGWLFGDDENEEAEQSGEAAASSYADGVSSGSGSVSAALSDVVATFSNIDTTTVSEAGNTAAAAYTTGMTDSLNDFTFDPSGIGFDSTTLTANLSATGLESGTAFTASLGQSVTGYSIDTSGIVVDMSGLESGLMTAGTTGTAVLSDGISNNSEMVTAAAAGLASDVNGALDSGWNTAKSSAESAMGSLANTVQAKAQEAAQAVKAAFENMVITIPKPKIPVISVSTDSVSYGEGGNVSVPQFSVNWNALGGIFDAPAIFNTPENGLQGVGEAGPEAVLPLDTLWSRMEGMITDAVKQSSGASMIESLLQRVRGITDGAGSVGGGLELAGAGGPSISYAPVYNLYGSATKEEAVEAERLSQADFNKMMKQWQRENSRIRF